jgi:DMSO reductase anchor subunit
MLKEWPLVAFTIAGQMAVGVFLLACIPQPMFAGPPGNAAAHGMRLVVLAIVFALMVLATALSFFHLHHPLRARRVLANFRTSWLSREIFFEIGFMALVALAALLVWTGSARGALLKGVLAAAGLAGILFLLSMSRLYMLETLPFWNQAYTPLSFFLTSLSLGGLAAALVLGASERRPSQAGLFTLLSFILVAGDIAVAFFISPGQGVFGGRPSPSLRPPAETPRSLHPARLAFLIAALVLIGAVLMAGNSRADHDPARDVLLVAALALVLAGQVVGRFLFYGLLTRPGR